MLKTTTLAMWRSLALAFSLMFPLGVVAVTAGCLIPYGPSDGDDDEDDEDDDDDNDDDDDDDNDNDDDDDNNNPPPDDDDPPPPPPDDDFPPPDDDPPPASDDTGETCQTDADCDDICIFEVDDPGAGICTKRCESFADCPTFWDCSDIGAAAGTYCTP